VWEHADGTSTLCAWHGHQRESHGTFVWLVTAAGGGCSRWPCRHLGGPPRARFLNPQRCHEPARTQARVHLCRAISHRRAPAGCRWPRQCQFCTVWVLLPLACGWQRLQLWSVGAGML